LRCPAIDWFIEQWGLKKSKIAVETAFHPDVNYRPTFVVPLDDGHIFCLDVAGSIYSNTYSMAIFCGPVKTLRADFDISAGQNSKIIIVEV
jgi:hypothetical protein